MIRNKKDTKRDGYSEKRLGRLDIERIMIRNTKDTEREGGRLGSNERDKKCDRQ